MKIKQLLGFICFSVLALFSSCNKSTTNSSEPLSSDAQISNVILDNSEATNILKSGILDTPSIDSLSAYEINLLKYPSKIKFSINQLNGEIYNADSLPKGFKVKTLSPLIEFQTINVHNVTYQMTDSTIKNYSPKLELTITKPITFWTTALDGSSQKKYTLKINVHKQNPNQIAWSNPSISNWGPTSYDQNKTIFFDNKYLTIFTSSGSSTFYTSTDGLNWAIKNSIIGFPTDAKLQSLTAFGNKLFITGNDQSIYSSDITGIIWTKLSETGVQNIIGSILDIQGTSHLIVIKNNQLFATTNGSTFTSCSNTLPDDFPTSGYSTITSTVASIQRLTVVGGKSSTGLLNTVHQMFWSNSGLQLGLNINNNANYFAPREGATSFLYDNKMYFMLGKDATTAYRDIYSSSDYGITWIKVNIVQNLPTSFEKRSLCSVVIDYNKSILLFGGNRIDNTSINDIWKGRLNRFGFIIQ